MVAAWRAMIVVLVALILTRLVLFMTINTNLVRINATHTTIIARQAATIFGNRVIN